MSDAIIIPDPSEGVITEISSPGIVIVDDSSISPIPDVIVDLPRIFAEVVVSAIIPSTPSEEPHGTGRVEQNNLSFAASSNSYSVWSVYIEGRSQDMLWISGIRAYTAGGGNVLVEIVNLNGDILSYGNYVDSPAGSPSWKTIVLDAPFRLRNREALAVVFTNSSNAKTYRNTSSNTFSGDLFGILSDKMGRPRYIDPGSSFTESMMIGVVEYNSAP